MTTTARTRKNPTYLAWANMHARCRDPHQAKWYSGVSVCPRWADYAAFLSDVGARPGAGYSLDRIDSAGNYAPGNVRWATKQTQARNCRVYANTASGVRGVTWNKRERKWQARILVGTKRRSLGFFFSLENARLARRAGELLYWGAV